MPAAWKTGGFFCVTGKSPAASGGAGSCQQFGEILIAEQELKVGQRPRHALAPHKQGQLWLPLLTAVLLPTAPTAWEPWLLEAP